MNFKKLVFIALLLAAFSAEHLFAQPNIYLVRHSEKIDDWPGDLSDFQPLDEKGVKTSETLAKYFMNIRLSAVYSSKLTRTLQTAYFVSKSQKLGIQIHEACNDTALIDSFLKQINEEYNSNESVLLVSHSNIIPYFLIKLGLKKSEYEKMNFTDSGDWFLTDYYGEVFIIEQNIESNKIIREKF